MTTLVITTRDDQELGFVLFARHDGMWPPAGTNDCIITPFPASDSSLLDDPAARFVAEHAGKEWVAEIGYGEDEMTVSIAFSTGWTFDLTSGAESTSWTAMRDGVTLEGAGFFL
jgi:hypothetical protein